MHSIVMHITYRSRFYCHRAHARDECQRFTNGDLFNPEYPDEQEFINKLISVTPGTNVLTD